MPNLPDFGVKATVANIGTFKRDIQGAEDAVAHASGALGLMGIAATAAVAALAAGIQQMDAVNGALARVAAQTGTAVSQLGPFRKSMENLFATGLVDNWDQTAENIQLTTEKIRGMVDGTKQVDDFARAAAGMEKAWGTSADSVISGAQSLIEKFAQVHTTIGGVSDVTITGARALDILAATAQQAHLPLDQVDQIVQQYGSSFAAAGFSADQLGGLLAKAGQTGVTNFRNLASGVMQFQKDFSHPPKGFNDAMSQLGLNQVAYDVRNNKISIADGLDQVYGKLAVLASDSSTKLQANTIAMTLFGTSIDKLGGPEQLAKLAGFSKGLGDITGAADNVAAVMEDDGTLGTAIHKFGNNVKVGLEQVTQQAYDRIKSIDWKKIGDSIAAIVQYFKPTWDDWMGPNGKLSKPVKDAADAVGQAIGSILSTAQDIAGKIGTAISGLVKDIQDPFTNNQVAIVIQKIGDAIRGIFNTVTEVGGMIGAAIQSFVKDMENPLSTSPIKTLVSDIAGAIRDIFAAAQDVGNRIGNAFNDIVKALQDPTSQASKFIKGIGDAINAVLTTAQDVLSGVSAAFGAIGKAITDGLAAAKAFIDGLLAAIAKITNFHGGGAPTSGNVQQGATSNPGFHAAGGKLTEGWNVVGEKGAELIYKAGGSAQVITNKKSQQILGQAQQGLIQAAALALNVAPSSAPIVNSRSITNNNSSTQRNLTINMNGVQGGQDAMQRFAMLYAMRKI